MRSPRARRRSSLPLHGTSSNAAPAPKRGCWPCKPKGGSQTALRSLLADDHADEQMPERRPSISVPRIVRNNRALEVPAPLWRWSSCCLPRSGVRHVRRARVLAETGVGRAGVSCEAWDSWASGSTFVPRPTAQDTNASGRGAPASPQRWSPANDDKFARLLVIASR